MYRTVLLVAALSSLTPGLALGQGDTDLAKGYYKLGVDLYNRADYEEALKQFHKAFKHSGKATLFHNIARCNESLGKHEEAVKFYERYLKEGKPADPAVISARIANLRRLIAKKNASKPRPASRPVKPASQPAKDPGKKPVVVPVPLPPAPQGRPLRTAGWVLVGVGGASLVAGFVLGGMAADMAGTLEKKNKDQVTDYADVKDDEDTGRGYETGQILALAVGGAAAAAGVVLLILDARKQRKERRAWLTPAFTPGGAVVTGGFSF